MKVSEITTEIIADYLRIDEYNEDTIKMMLEAAIQYVTDYTGIPTEQLDNYPTFNVAVLCLIQDMYDNRSMYVDKTVKNHTVESILYMYRRNFL